MSEHFNMIEFACHDGTPYPLEWGDRLIKLCAQLEIIRVAWAGPIVVVSGFRTDAYNRRIGGALRSQHVEGRAADIRPVSIGDVPEFTNLVRRLMAIGQLPDVGGFGAYPGWVHVDVRDKPPSGHVAQWTGNGVGSEQAA